jgi:hypothetical protein
VPLRTICWLLLAIVGGSTIGFKLALPGSDSAPAAASAQSAASGPAPPFTFAPPGGRRVVHSTGLDTSGPQSTPGLRPLTASQDQSVGRSDTSTPAGETPAIGFDAPYVSDLRFLALPGIPTSPTTTTPADTTTTTPAAPVGPPPEIENVHTTALTPFSATIAWRTSVPASSRIAYGLDAPVIWTPASGASTEHQATLTGLGFDDSYKLAVTAVNDGGAARVAEFVLTTPSLSGPVQMTTSNGAILLNGQPSFPKLVWAQCPDAAAGNLAVGIDLFMGNGCGTGAQLAKWVAGRAFVLANAQSDAAGRAGTVGTHLPDEWDTHLPGDFTTADALRLVPPTPGSGPRFLTLTNHFYSRASPLPQGKGMYPALAASADVLGFDLYPLQNWCRFDSFGDVFDSQLDLVALGRGRPTFQWIEARRMDCFGDQLDPTPQTVRAEAWLSIAGGAHAIGYFPNNWSLDVGAEIARTNHEIQSLAPALVEPAIAASVAPESVVKVGAREHNGAVYVIAVNASRNAAASQINVPALGDRVLQSLDGMHTVTARSGSFTDSFAPLEVRIYVASPFQG